MVRDSISQEEIKLSVEDFSDVVLKKQNIAKANVLSVETTGSLRSAVQPMLELQDKMKAVVAPYEKLKSVANLFAPYADEKSVDINDEQVTDKGDLNDVSSDVK